MIQSSQPSSLKLTCSAFLLHLDLDFLPCLFPCRLFSAVLRLRRDLNWRPVSSSDFPVPRDLIFSFISLNRFSLFFDLVYTTKMAFSCWDRPLLSKPNCFRSISVSDLPSVTLSWRQSWIPWAEFWWVLNISHTSKTSHPGFVESSGSRDLESSSLSDRQENNWMS